VTPASGWAVARFGRRSFAIGILFTWMAGIALTLAAPLPLILLGLTVCVACGMVCQALSTSAVAITAQAGRSSAVGFYGTSFYVGGSFGAALGGLAWTFGRWPACVAMVVIMLTIMATVVIVFWPRGGIPAPREAVEPS